MALPVYIFNLITHTNLVQDVSPTTGKILNNVTEPATYENTFFFSHQTISSIGYGALAPRSDASNWFVAFFGFFGFIVLSMLSGIIWSKFTTSNGALVAISKKAVVTKFEGKRALMFRMAGLWRHHPITTATVTAMVYVPLRNNVDGQIRIVSKPLKFVRSFNPFFLLPGTFVHIMEDDDSPLKVVTSEELSKKTRTSNRLWVSLVFEGVDTCRGETVAGQYLFTHEDILWGQRFEDVLRFDTLSDIIHVDMDKFHLTVPDGLTEEKDELKEGVEREEMKESEVVVV
jgi:inward rectifier potassium channel